MTLAQKRFNQTQTGGKCKFYKSINKTGAIITKGYKPV